MLTPHVTEILPLRRSAGFTPPPVAGASEAAQRDRATAASPLAPGERDGRDQW